MFLYFIAFFIILFYWPSSLLWQDEILYARGISNYIDWPVHFAQMSKVAYQPWEQWFTTSPFMLNTQNSYPFAADIPSGLLLRLGLSPHSAFLIPSIIYSVILLGTLYAFLKKRQLGLNEIGLVIAIFFFASMPNSSGVQPQTWFHLFSPNRSLILAFALILWAYELIEMLCVDEAPRSKKDQAKKLGALVVITLALCVLHPHSLLSTAVVAGVFLSATYILKKKVNPLLIAWGLISLIIVLIFKNTLWIEATAGYPRLNPTWTLQRFEINPLFFWPVFGGIPFLAGIYFGVRHRRWIDLSIIAALVLLHLLFQWQINEYDNVKNTVLLSFLCAFLVGKYSSKIVLYAVVVISLIPSLPEWMEMFPLTTKSELELAQFIQNELPPNAITIIDNRHNHFLPMFTTLKTLAWYDYYNWTYGLANKEQNTLRIQALTSPMGFSYHKSVYYIVRNDGSYSDYELSQRFKGLGAKLSFNRVELGQKRPLLESHGYSIYLKEVNP